MALNYQEYIPSESLRSYVKCYYVYETDAHHFVNDNAFATGCVEVMFNLDDAQWETKAGKPVHSDVKNRTLGTDRPAFAFKARWKKVRC